MSNITIMPDGHSNIFARVLMWYKAGVYTDKQVRALAEKEKILPEEVDQIINWRETQNEPT